MVTALMSMLLLAIFSAYASGIRIWRSIKESGLAQDRRFYISTEKIKSELKGCIRDFKDIEFEGDKDKLIFPSVADLTIVTTTYKFDKKKKALMKEVVKFSESLKDKMEKRTIELFGADAVKFSYLFYDKKVEAAKWDEDFKREENGIPEAVKFDITRKGKRSKIYVFIPR